MMLFRMTGVTSKRAWFHGVIMQFSDMGILINNPILDLFGKFENYPKKQKSFLLNYYYNNYAPIKDNICRF